MTYLFTRIPYKRLSLLVVLFIASCAVALSVRPLFAHASVTSDVSGLYTTYFCRQPDTAGLNYWVGQINSGTMTFAAVKSQFLASSEARTCATNTITGYYNTILHRAPDTAGLNYWVSQVLSGALTFSQVQSAFQSQAAATPASTTCTHSGSYTCSSKNVLNSCGIVVKTCTSSQTCQASSNLNSTCITTPTTTTTSGSSAASALSTAASIGHASTPPTYVMPSNPSALSNEQFVEYVYWKYLGRQPDYTGYNYWLGVLNGGTSRSAVESSFASSAEGQTYSSTGVAVTQEAIHTANQAAYTGQSSITAQSAQQTANIQFITNLYETNFNRPPDAGGMAYWLAQMDAGVSQSAVAAAFTSAPEHISGGGTNTPPDADGNFTFCYSGTPGPGTGCVEINAADLGDNVSTYYWMGQAGGALGPQALVNQMHTVAAGEAGSTLFYEGPGGALSGIACNNGVAACILFSGTTCLATAEVAPPPQVQVQELGPINTGFSLVLNNFDNIFADFLSGLESSLTDLFNPGRPDDSNRPSNPDQCFSRPVCSEDASRVVDSCTGAVLEVCPAGCQSGECLPAEEEQCTNANICAGNTLVDGCSGRVIVQCILGCSNSACVVPPIPTAPQNPAPSIPVDVAPVVTFNVTPRLVRDGGTVQITWTAEGVQSCAVSGTNNGSWSGLSETQTSQSIHQQTVFTINCPSISTNHPDFTQSITVNILPSFMEL